jgi:hypothetical protein
MASSLVDLGIVRADEVPTGVPVDVFLEQVVHLSFHQRSGEVDPGEGGSIQGIAGRSPGGRSEDSISRQARAVVPTDAEAEDTAVTRGVPRASLDVHTEGLHLTSLLSTEAEGYLHPSTTNSGVSECPHDLVPRAVQGLELRAF